MPEASASGRLAKMPIAMVMMAAPKHVDVRAASNGMPAMLIINGLTAMM